VRRGLLGAALTLVAITGCGVPTQESPTRLDNNNVHLVGPGPSTTTHRGTPTDRVRMCFVSGRRLVTIVRELPAPQSVRSVLEALVEMTPIGLPPGARSVISDQDFAATGVALAWRGIALVDLKSDFLQISSADQVLGLAQVVCTLTSLPGVGQVRFTLHGDPVEIPRADGSLTGEPVSRSDYEDLFPSS